MQGEKQNSAESKSSLYNDKSKAYVEKVIMDLSEVLRQPSDIDSKLEMLEAEAKDNYEIHQNKFNTKISNAYSQIKNLNNNFDKLKLNLKLFENKKNQNIQILEDFSALIKDYKTISSICVAHQRFFKIKNFIEKLNNINDDLTDDDLLVYHNRVYQDEEFACELQQYNYELLPDDLSRVENAKEIIQKKSLEFTLILMELIKDFINNYKSISHINEIVDQEEKRDELTRMAIEGDKGKDPVLTQVAKMYPRYITRNVKNLKIKLIKVIKSSIRESLIPKASLLFQI